MEQWPVLRLQVQQPDFDRRRQRGPPSQPGPDQLEPNMETVEKALIELESLSFAIKRITRKSSTTRSTS